MFCADVHINMFSAGDWLGKMALPTLLVGLPINGDTWVSAEQQQFAGWWQVPPALLVLNFRC